MRRTFSQMIEHERTLYSRLGAVAAYDESKVVRLPPGPEPETPWCDEPRRRMSGCQSCGAKLVGGGQRGARCSCAKDGRSVMACYIWTYK